MKKYFYLIISILLLSACSKKAEVVVPAVKIAVKDAGEIKYKAAPLSENSVKLDFLGSPDYELKKIILKQDTTTLATSTVTANSNVSFSATVNYPFKPGVKYNFSVQTTVVSNSVQQYHVSDYVHTYASAYNYQKILSLHQSMGPNGFDISPSRKYLFISDDVNNVVQVKRVSLQTLTVDNLDYNLIGAGPLRAVSDNELLVTGDNSTENLPKTADPGTDAVILAKYNISTKKSTFVDYVSSDYGRTSRIVNNHVLVTNPVYTAQTASLINLADLSRIKYSLNTDIDFRFINEYSFNHILYNSELLNTGTGKFTQPLNLDANSGIAEIDDATGYSFVQRLINNASGVPVAGFAVYKSKAVVYDSGYKLGISVYLPVIYNIKNDVLTYYQYFDYDTSEHTDGYYTLNLKTGESKLIQAESNVYVRSDYQLKDGSVFSVKADGVYKLTLK